MASRHAILLTTATALVTGAVGLAVPASAGAATPSAASCDKAPWEATVQGRPAVFRAGAPAGDYLWHDRRGFHLRVTHARHDRRVYRGEITAAAPMRMERVKLEKGDRVALSKNRRTIVFAFVNHGYVDGINFHAYCADTVTVSHLRAGSHRLAPDHVYLGAAGAHPAGVPFTVHRVPVTT